MAKTTFIDGNPSLGIVGTKLLAAFLNALNTHRHMGTDVDGDGAIGYAADTGAPNAYVVALSPVLAAHVVGMPIRFKASNANTAASTINVNGLGAIAIKRPDGSVLQANDILAEQIITVIYDGTYYQLAFAPTNVPVGGQCRLTKSGANLLLSPCQGNKIVIAGQAYSIPAAGVTLAPAGLTPSTLYYIYCYNNAGTLTLEASTTTHATDTTAGNIGVEIKSGDTTRSLVGMAYVITGPAFASSATQQYVLSWFNRQRLAGIKNFTTDRTTTSASYTEINSEIRVGFLTWENESVFASVTGSLTASVNQTGTYTAIAIDSTTAAYTGLESGMCPVGNQTNPIGISGEVILAEGMHYATIIGATTSSATATWFASTTVGNPGKSKVCLIIGVRG